MVHGHALGQHHAVVLLGLIGDHHDFDGPLGPHALGNLHHAVAFGTLTDLLAAGHGNGVVVQNFVGDVDAGRNALAYRQQTTVEVGAVAQVGKHVLVVAERLLPHPWHALATHLGEAHMVTVHPDGHEMAANASHGARAFWQLGAGVVRTARAKPRLAIRQLDIGLGTVHLQHVHGAFFGVQNRQLRVDARGGVRVHTHHLDALGNGPRNEGWR